MCVKCSPKRKNVAKCRQQYSRRAYSKDFDKICSTIWTVQAKFYRKVLTNCQFLRNGKYALNKKNRQRTKIMICGCNA